MTDAIRREVREQIESIGPCDILIGIPTCNHADTVGPVVEAVRAGLAKSFPEAKALLVNADGGSIDNTPEAFASAAGDAKTILFSHRVDARHKIAAPYHGLPGKESAFRMILEIAGGVQARACGVVDAGLLSMTPAWIDRLIGPILNDGYDYIAPLYHRPKYDGTITHAILYPLIRALYGLQVRQPIGGDFAFTGNLAGRFLSEAEWESELARYGIDLWMTTTAITEGFKVGQAYLGPKANTPRDLGIDLAGMLVQVLGSAFAVMEQNPAFWKKVSGSKPIPILGYRQETLLKPVPVNAERMVKAFDLGLSEFIPLWDGVLSRGVLEELTGLRRPGGSFTFPDDLWARVIYDFALAVHRKVMAREHLLKSFTPLYLGKVASFVLETGQSDYRELDRKVEAFCLAFEREKAYLVDQWEKPSDVGGGP